MSHKKQTSSLSRDIFDYSFDGVRQESPKRASYRETPIVLETTFMKGKKLLGRDLSEVMGENKTLTGKIGFLNRRSERSIKRLKDLHQTKQMFASNKMIGEVTRRQK